MRVVPFVGRQGDAICAIDRLIGVFDRRGPKPEPGVEIEVMACAVIIPRSEAGAAAPIRTVILRQVTADDILIDHKGFECSGSMCRTTANLTEASDMRVQRVCGKRIYWVTPGRTPVIETGNVNIRFDRSDARPLWPGQAYVSMADLKEGLTRISGVPHLALLHWQVVVRMGLFAVPLREACET